jgi:hypothetical protein
LYIVFYIIKSQDMHAVVEERGRPAEAMHDIQVLGVRTLFL